MTIFEAYNTTKQKLEKSGIVDYVFEAKQIIKHITGLSSTQILTMYNKQLTEFQQNNLTAIIHQRQVRYPLQYIFGEWDFYGRPFCVGPGVLIPRADTEILAEYGLQFVKEIKAPKVLDLCAGSGALGITLACERADAEVVMVEKYDEALFYTEKNISRNNADNAKAVKGDVFEGIQNEGKYNLIISNPPYISESEINYVSPETDYEPRTALFAKDNGMEFYKAIIENYSHSLVNGGMLAFEVGINEDAKVRELLLKAGYNEITVKKDLNGINRVVSGIMYN